ncbi:MAG: T9SS type A sorting domain-containing protein [Bacteroidota bacterium]
MKKNIYTLLFLLMLFVPVRAQFINTLRVYPANPTTADSVLLLADVSFPSGTCETYMHTFSPIGSDFHAYSIHCVGPLTYICNATDTFYAGILSAGTHRFIYSVDAGFGPMPCNPGIVAGPTDTLNFIVSVATGITDPSNPIHPDFYINEKYLYLKHPGKSMKTAYIYNVNGQVVLQRTVKEENTISLEGIASGIYTLMLTSGNDQSAYRFMLP